MRPTTGALDTFSILAAPISPVITSKIGGNAPVELKELSIKWYDILSVKGNYGREIRDMLDITEVSIIADQDGEGESKQVRVLCELTVLPGMCNAEGLLDNGSMTFLMDEGSGLAMYIWDTMQGKPAHKIFVSQSLNFLFYGSVPIGGRIKIINRSIKGRRDSGSCTSEIRDASNGRLMASGTQVVSSASENNNGRERRTARL